MRKPHPRTLPDSRRSVPVHRSRLEEILQLASEALELNDRAMAVRQSAMIGLELGSGETRETALDEFKEAHELVWQAQDCVSKVMRLVSSTLNKDRTFDE